MKYVTHLLLSIALAGCAAYSAPRDADFARVHDGMSRDETLRLLGKPHETMRFPLSGNESWSYYAFDPWGYYCRYSVTFGPQAVVVAKISERLNDGGEHGSGK